MRRLDDGIARTDVQVKIVMQFAIAFDQFLNCFISWAMRIGGGWADETFSARCWREGKTSRAWNAARIAVDTLLWFDRQHCFQSYISEFERKQLPEEYRRKGMYG